MSLKDAYFDLRSKKILDKEYDEGSISTAVYEEENQGLEDARERFDAAYSQEDDEKLIELIDRAMRIGDIKAEFSEAEDAARSVLYCAREVEREAVSAEGWGIFDVIGGGLFTSIIKRGKMQNAKDYAGDMKHAIERLNMELDDINELFRPGDSGFDMAVSFADIFFDGIFIDIYTLGKIRSMKEEAINIKEKTAILISRLQTSQEELDLKLRGLEDEIRKYESY